MFDGGVLDPKGPVGGGERLILLDATFIMLAVVIPVILMTLAFAWWYREGNPRARRLPDFEYSGRIELVTWSVPALIVLFLSGIAWIGAHQLDPRKGLEDAKSAALDVEVVSLDWKWLFIYPHQGVASVNELVLPVGTPVRFHLTSGSVMNSFFVPQLGSQVYTMAGMVTELNLRADEAGSYPGLSAQFSGEGFSDMRFTVRAVPRADFDGWATAGAGQTLDRAHFAQLAQPSTSAAAHFSKIEPDLFQAIVDAHGAEPHAQEGH
jgi:cytochrome o ubiquinol oxidase subunit 2